MKWVPIDEERDWLSIDKKIHELSLLPETQNYCYTLNDHIEPADHILPVLCVKEQSVDPIESQIQILSVQVVTYGADIDWGPIGVNRGGYVNILGSRHKSFHLQCQVETDIQSDTHLQFKWLRNGAYMGVNSQVNAKPNLNFKLNFLHFKFLQFFERTFHSRRRST